MTPCAAVPTTTPPTPERAEEKKWSEETKSGHLRSPSEESETTEEGTLVRREGGAGSVPRLDVKGTGEDGAGTPHFPPTPETTPREQPYQEQQQCYMGMDPSGSWSPNGGYPMNYMQMPMDAHGVPMMPQGQMVNHNGQMMMAVPAHMMQYMMGPHGMPMVPMMMPMGQECWQDWQQDPRMRKQRKPRRGRAAGAKVFVGGLGPNTTSATIHGFFEQFGPVFDAAVLADAVTKRSRGFGFVEFANVIPDGVLGIEHMIDGRRCGVRKYDYTPTH